MSELIKKQLMDLAKQKGHGNIFPCNTFNNQKTWDECYDIIPEMNVVVLYFNIQSGSTLLVKVSL